jgi:hypothetical protein
MLLLLLGAGTLNFVLAEPLDGITLMSFVVVVVAISIYQEHKTEIGSSLGPSAARRDAASCAVIPTAGVARSTAVSSVMRSTVSSTSPPDQRRTAVPVLHRLPPYELSLPMPIEWDDALRV